MSKTVVLIIAHKPALTAAERASLVQCHRILGNHVITLICPRGLDVSAYLAAVPNVNIDFIDPVWQSNYAMFNKLKTSALLYDRYSDFDYILFYELDAWVFRDELDYWCRQEYDYIGAPWFEEIPGTAQLKFKGVGNGGLSLRNIRSSLRVLKKVKRLKFFHWVYVKLNLIQVMTLATYFEAIKFLWNEPYNEEAVRGIVSAAGYHEDVFWGLFIPKLFPFKVAPPPEAARFSFEGNPSFLYERNKGKLPFGCHAWEKNEPEFWSSYISF